jgi:hypothetical protein
VAQLWKILHYKNSLLVYLLIILAFNIFLLFFPLTNVFGFEFSALNAILLTFLCGIYILVYCNKNKGGLSELHLAQIAFSFIVFLLLPFIISFLHAIFTLDCSFKDGLLFYLVITLPSVLIGAALGIMCYSFFYRIRILAFILIFILILLIPLAEFYFNPQVYFYNPIFGYFPGTIYDEALTVSFKLFTYRLCNIIFFGGIFILLYKSIKSKFVLPKEFIFSFIMLIAVSFIYLSPYLGYSTTFRGLDSILDVKYETEHFVIHFSPNIKEKTRKIIALYEEYYYLQLEKFYHTEMKNKINSYIFYNSAQKEKLFGSANADVAKPWLHSVFVDYEDYDSILRHELAHCFSANFGTGILKLASGLNPSLIEGVAVSGDPFYGDNTIDYMAALAYQNGYKINIQNLFGGFTFYTQVSSLSYVYAGSFVKYLIDKYGIEKFKKLYSDINFRKIYGKSLDEIAGNYYSYLNTIDASNRKDQADYYYGSSSIFSQVCPRYVSDRLNKAWRYYEAQNYGKAENIFTEILSKTANYSAVIGMAKSLSMMNNNTAAAKILSAYLGQFKNSSYFYSIELNLADSYSLCGKFQKADSIYKSISLQNPGRNYFFLSNLRQDLLAKDSLIIYYNEGSDIDKFLILSKLNEDKYYYNSIPLLLNIAESLNINYSVIMKELNKPFSVDDYASSYAMLELSHYMAANLDFKDAEKIASLSLKYKGNENYMIVVKENYNEINWIYQNSSRIIIKKTN